MPKITIIEEARYDMGVALPSPNLDVSIFDLTGNKVGAATYSVSPLKDCIYLSKIEIYDAFRRKGYGLAFLILLGKTHTLPIIPILQLESADSFWGAAREFVAIKPPLSMHEMETERCRWTHLQPENDLLKKVIDERLHIHREPYAKAVGRGLNE